MSKYKILNVSENFKTKKSEKVGYLTGIIYLAPHTTANIKDSKGKLVNLCPASNEACRSGCLFTAGLASVFKQVNESRIKKTQRLFDDAPCFMKDLKKEIGMLINESMMKGMKPCVRLNGTSDINWSEFLLDGMTIFEHYPQVQFYDYTKRVDLYKTKPDNLHLTYSFSGSNMIQAQMALDKGYNVTVVVSSKEMKQFFLQDADFFTDGDDTDLRFLDESNKVVVLTAKGQAKKDTLGFLVA